MTRRSERSTLLFDSVLQASALDLDWESLFYDFLASDGFRPSEHSCPPLNHTTVLEGHFFVSNGNLVFPDALDLAGCYYVDGVVEIDVQKAR